MFSSSSVREDLQTYSNESLTPRNSESPQPLKLKITLPSGETEVLYIESELEKSLIIEEFIEKHKLSEEEAERIRQMIAEEDEEFS